MNRLYTTVFVFILLLSQWGSLDHVYHVHDSAEVCDFCLSAQALDHGALHTASIVFTPSHHQSPPELVRLTVFRNNVRYFSVRAPPHFI